MDCSPSGSSVHGILQARILAWVAISLSRGKSPVYIHAGQGITVILWQRWLVDNRCLRWMCYYHYYQVVETDTERASFSVGMVLEQFPLHSRNSKTSLFDFLKIDAKLNVITFHFSVLLSPRYLIQFNELSTVTSPWGFALKSSLEDNVRALVSQ